MLSYPWATSFSSRSLMIVVVVTVVTLFGENVNGMIQVSKTNIKRSSVAA